MAGDSPTINELTPDYLRDLQRRKLSPRTVTGYADTLRLFDRFIAENGWPREVASVRRDAVEAWDAHLQRTGRSEATRDTRHRGLLAFWKWAVEQGEIKISPMRGLHPPRIPDKAPPILTTEQITRLLRATAGDDLDARRDHAILRVLADTGMRRGELERLRRTDVDPTPGAPVLFVVRSKGGGHGEVPIGPDTLKALRRYLRLRDRRLPPESGPLWIGRKGPLGASGIASMLRRRCRQAGLDPRCAHPHAWRHLAAHTYLSGGLSTGDLMRIMGWKSRAMVDRYGSALADERAIVAARRILDRASESEI
jgi:integrase